MERQQSATAPEAQQRPFIAAVWLLLAAIFAHALLPVGTPMSKLSGSAFSAGTVDVSLQPVRSSVFSSPPLQDETSRSGADGGDGPSLDDVLSARSDRRLALAPHAGLSRATESLPILRPAGSRPQAARAPPIP